MVENELHVRTGGSEVFRDRKVTRPKAKVEGSADVGKQPEILCEDGRLREVVSAGVQHTSESPLPAHRRPAAP
jgi:hypothetical protein